MNRYQEIKRAKKAIAKEGKPQELTNETHELQRQAQDQNIHQGVSTGRRRHKLNVLHQVTSDEVRLG